MDERNFEKAHQYALHRLEQELSPNLFYHGITHTRDDVVPAAELLASMEGIQGESLYLLLTAAWFHDLGFVQQPIRHELTGAQIAAEVLPRLGYTDAQIEVVRGAILATALPQSPSTLLEEIMTDADLAVLGREDFLIRNDNLRRELAFFGKVYGDPEWYAEQLMFVEAHTYFTVSARTLWDAAKLKNLADLKQKLKEVR